MRYCKPIEQDVSQIHNLLEQNIQSNLNSFDQGFLCNSIPLAELQKRIRYGHYNRIVADDKVIGYLLAFDNQEAEEYLQLGYLAYENNIFFQHLNLKEKFIWLDQLCIIKEERGRGYGRYLLKQSIEEYQENGYNNFYGIVSISPNFNLRSFTFLHKTFGINVISTLDINSIKWALVKLNTHGI